MGSTGANFAFRSSIYSAVGGYSKDEWLAEDVALGRAIRYARKGVNTIEFADPKSRLYTSSRRAIDAWKSGIVPFEQWNKGFSAFDNEVRGFEINKESTIVDFDNKEYLEKLKKELEYVLTTTVNAYEKHAKQGEDNEDYQRSIQLLGIKYKKVNDKIIIEDMNPLVDKLKEYQKKGVKLRDYKSGKISQEEFNKSVPDKKPTKSKTKPESVTKPEIKPELKPEKVLNKKEELDLSKLTLAKLYEQAVTRVDKSAPLILKGWENKRLKLDKERLVILTDYVKSVKELGGTFMDLQADSFLSYEKVKHLVNMKKVQMEKELLESKNKLDLARAKYKASL